MSIRSSILVGFFPYLNWTEVTLRGLKLLGHGGKGVLWLFNYLCGINDELFNEYLLNMTINTVWDLPSELTCTQRNAPTPTPVSLYCICAWYVNTHTHKCSMCILSIFNLQTRRRRSLICLCRLAHRPHTAPLFRSDLRQKHDTAEISPSDQQFHHFEGWYQG